VQVPKVRPRELMGSLSLGLSQHSLTFREQEGPRVFLWASGRTGSPVVANTWEGAESFSYDSGDRTQP
jgi:hypothetical protein